MTEYKASMLNNEQISKIADSFAEATNYKPGKTDIISYVKENLNGLIKYTDDKLDSSGGSIRVYEKNTNPENPFIIYLSRATSSKRDIFTIAHELGHYVLHSRLGAIPLEANRSQERNTVEREANSFAAAFLMPENQIKQKYKEFNGDIARLTKTFNVSDSAMLWRCKNLGL